MIQKLLTVLITAVALAAIAPATAHADGLLTVGMKLTFRHHDCSLGFFATDSVADQLAVTAGHCAQGLHEKVYNAWGQQVGEVVAWQPDVEDRDGKLTGSRGFTVVYTYKTFAIEAFFSGLGAAKIGDRVRVYGQRTNGSNGTITNASYTPGRPDLDVLTSDVLLVPGDSGGPLYSQGPTLIGIGSSFQEGARVSYAQPLHSLEQEIKAGGGRYACGFSVYTQG
jgi:hypothetical protein